VTVATALGVSLEVSCGWNECGELARPLFAQLSSGDYRDMSVMRIPADVVEWRAGRKTARKAADRAERRGYTFHRIQRHLHNDEIYAINISKPQRQGRPMSNGYRQPVAFSPLPHYPCDRHAIRTYGVNDPYGTLVAYLWLYRAGDLALVSSILGHADHEDNEIMYLLWQGMVGSEAFVDPDGFIVYNVHSSGTPGLRFKKERYGLHETRVEWLP